MADFDDAVTLDDYGVDNPDELDDLTDRVRDPEPLPGIVHLDSTGGIGMDEGQATPGDHVPGPEDMAYISDQPMYIPPEGRKEADEEE